MARAAWAFLALMAIGFAAGLLRPESTFPLMERFSLAAAEAGMYELDSGALMLTLLVTNLLTCLLAIAVGLVPFLRLTALFLGMNALLLGAFAAWYAQSGPGLAAYLAGTAPHGLTELSALTLCCGAGLYLCDCVTLRMLGRESGPTAASALGRCLRLFLRYAAPLLALSALLEAYVTPRLFALFYTAPP